jgi:hypothetical protein
VEQESVGLGWNHVFQVARVVKATIQTPPDPSLKSVTAAPDQNKLTPTKEGGAAAIPELKSTKALRQPKVKNTLEEVKAGKSSSKIPKPTTPTPAPKITQSPIEEVSGLLLTLPIDSCEELTRRLLIEAPNLPSWAARSRAAQKSLFSL